MDLFYGFELGFWFCSMPERFKTSCIPIVSICPAWISPPKRGIQIFLGRWSVLKRELRLSTSFPFLYSKEKSISEECPWISSLLIERKIYEDKICTNRLNQCDVYDAYSSCDGR